MSFETSAENTWCPGCGNFPLLVLARKAVSELIEEGKIEKRNVVVISGIGCHGKITSYLDLNSVHTAHGRVLPMAVGTKLGNPNLHVIGFGGDGDTYDEGMAHFIHAARNNVNFTCVVHDNKMFSLTTGQPTATTSYGTKTKSTPQGKPSQPINPLTLALDAGATFVARGYSFHIDRSKELLKQAIMHDGFGFIDMIQPCVVYNDTRAFMNEHAYWMDPEPASYQEAFQKAREWDYNREDEIKVPLGLFYKTDEPTFEEKWPSLQPWYKMERKVERKELFQEFK